jgi:hypothetical protein
LVNKKVLKLILNLINKMLIKKKFIMRTVVAALMAKMSKIKNRILYIIMVMMMKMEIIKLL